MGRVSLKPVTVLLTVLFLAGANPQAGGAQLKAGAQDAPKFEKDVAPLFRSRCVACHGPSLQMGGLRLDRREDALRGGNSGKAIEPGNSAASRLYVLVTTGIDVE